MREDYALLAAPCSFIVTEVPSVVASRKAENKSFAVEVKGTFWNVSRVVRAMTSVFAGSSGTFRRAKSPTSRFANREAAAEPLPIVIAVYRRTV